MKFKEKSFKEFLACEILKFWIDRHFMSFAWLSFNCGHFSEIHNEFSTARLFLLTNYCLQNALKHTNSNDNKHRK